MLKMTKQNLKKELNKYKLMLLQYRSDKSFQITINNEIKRIENELAFFDSKKKS